MSQTIYLFDVDGTLTPPRQKMTSAVEDVFLRLAKSGLVYLVSGSDIRKLREQVPAHVLDACSGIFASSANELWVGEELQYENVYVPSPALIKKLEGIVLASKYPYRTSNHIEHRPGMLNFSVIGRAANDPERSHYAEWDQRHQEREDIAKNLAAEHPEIDVNIGGEISIDICPKGLDKSQAVFQLRAEFPDYKIMFFGDRTEKGGNDYSVVINLAPGDTFHSVSGPEETHTILREILGYDE